MALSATQLTRLRHLTGGVVETSEADYLTDTQLQAEYTEANEDFDTTIVYVLRLRVGMSVRWTDRSYNSEQTSENLSQRHRHLKDLLALWEARTGLAGGTLSVATLDLDIDTDYDDVDSD
jgi:hypothetical protein